MRPPWFTERLLDSIDLLPGTKEFSLWDLLKGLVVVAVFVIVTSLIARTIERRVMRLITVDGREVASIPIDLAVPRTVLTAAARSVQLRSGIFCFAMSSTCLAVTVPTLLRFGSAEPFARLATFFSSTDAGGVLVMKL